VDEDRIEVRRIRRDEWKRLREVRLAALAEAPLAFITTLDEAKAHPDALWRERTETGAISTTQATFLATAGHRTVGLAVGVDRTATAPGVVAVVSVFVSSDVRRRGVASRLMAEVETWARSIGGTTLSLWVVDGNEAAARLYAGIGYRMTLDRQRINIPPQRWETRMVKDLIVD
jgi:GNAT superfamily N-acetyltransferase